MEFVLAFDVPKSCCL